MPRKSTSNTTRARSAGRAPSPVTEPIVEPEPVSEPEAAHTAGPAPAPETSPAQAPGAEPVATEAPTEATTPAAPAEPAPKPARMTDAEIYAAVQEADGTLKELLGKVGLKSKASLMNGIIRHCASTGDSVPKMPGAGSRNPNSSKLSPSVRGLAVGRGWLSKIGVNLPEPDAGGHWPEGVEKMQVAIQIKEVDGVQALVVTAA